MVASESLARKLGPKHQVTLVSRHRDFTFFPALVRLAFGRCAPEHVFFDLPLAMRSRRVGFVRAEIARLDPERRRVLVTHGGIEVQMPYDYLVFALGRRQATECVPGFLEHAHHLLTPGAALKFGEAVKAFHRGHAVIGYCQDARLAVPVYEAAFALDRLLRARGERGRTRITIVTPERPGGSVGGTRVAPALLAALGEHGIDVCFRLSRRPRGRHAHDGEARGAQHLLRRRAEEEFFDIPLTPPARAEHDHGEVQISGDAQNFGERFTHDDH